MGADGSNLYTHAVLFDPSGDKNNIDLGSLSGSQSYWSSASFINNQNNIIGSGTIGPSDQAGLFNYLSGEDNRPIGLMNNSTMSSALCINNNNQIVGDSYYPDTKTERATLFDIDDPKGHIDLGTLDDRAHCYATSINDKGQMVGYAHNTIFPNDSSARAVLFDSTGGGNNIDLGSLEGQRSYAYCIDEKGRIFGKAESDNGYMHAVMFDASGGGNNIDLNNWLPEDSGWLLLHAISVNDYGWIVGGGINPDGDCHAYLLKPVPEPTIISLFVVGSMFFIRWRKM